MRSFNFIFLTILIFCSLIDNKRTSSTQKDTISLDLNNQHISIIQLNTDEFITTSKNSMKNQINKKYRVDNNFCNL